MDRRDAWPVDDMALVTMGLVAYEPAGTIVQLVDDADEAKYPAGQGVQDVDPTDAENVPEGQGTHVTLDVLKYEPATHEAKAVITTRPLPPFPALDAWPGNPPTPTPETYPFAVTMLYVGAWPEEVPEEPAWVKAEPSWMQPPMKPLHLCVEHRAV